jgi:protein Mpv17
LRSWYGILDRLIKTTSPAKSAIAKMAVDQGIFAPFFLFNFIALLGFLNGDGVEQIKSDIKQNYVDIMITNYKVITETARTRLFFNLRRMYEMKLKCDLLYI